MDKETEENITRKECDGIVVDRRLGHLDAGEFGLGGIFTEVFYSIK